MIYDSTIQYNINQDKVRAHIIILCYVTHDDIITFRMEASAAIQMKK